MRVYAGSAAVAIGVTMRDKLQEILARYYDFLDAAQADEAAQAILDLLDKSLPSHKRQIHVEHGQQMPSVAQCKWYFDGYDQALADVRKVIKEV